MEPSTGRVLQGNIPREFIKRIHELDIIEDINDNLISNLYSKNLYTL